MISFKELSDKLVGTDSKRWLWIGLAGVPAIRFYYVREMIAALMIFSVLFVAVATFVVFFFLLDRASEQVLTWAEAGVARLVHRGKGASHGDIQFGKVAR
jgi:hypothetical protein